MGLFNVVITKKKCPNCKAKVEWQSKEIVDKSDNFIEPYLEKIKLKDIQVGEMHTLCDKCGYWIEYKIKNGKIKKIVEEHFKENQ